MMLHSEILANNLARMLRNINDSLSNKNSLHSVTRYILWSARCFGIFPVSGLRSPIPNELGYTLKAVYTLVQLTCFAGHFIVFVMSFLHLFVSGVSPRTFYKFLNHATGILYTILVFRLARQWPDIIKKSWEIERGLSEFHHKNIITNCKVAALIIFSGALLDYSMSTAFYAIFTSKACIEGNSLMESYYLYTMPSAAMYLPFNLVTFLLLQLINIQYTFIVNFIDILIIVVSLYLTSLFEELNSLINLYKDKSPNIWYRLRMEYTTLSRLVKIIDESMSSFIFFSFGSNMALICVQLFKLLRKDLAHSITNCDIQMVHEVLSGPTRAVYFNFSILFMIFRALGTAFFASRVHMAARGPLVVLYEIPSSCYSNEARRFVDQMHTNTVALSGMHFFYVTRELILSMVATIFTYELVLLQFSEY